ncbi:fatty acid-binding protein DegV [Lentilactobacillus curieae]|uniref:Fatty acid-binding protein DegV n=1 Tax=Lentilactobacillus curieae TaxID=1138822 RepID=A0A1S6QIB1_9LACO|nr:DegV family protein [Lentilactobacillus curieae]AQW21329.1 fatty acid-binding protein DegV [Lentilactobacillus curieae]
MANIRIVTDSAASLSQSSIRNHDIKIIDLPIIINGKLYGSVKNISSDKFLHLLSNCSSSPALGGADVSELANLYDELGSDGSQIISIHLSSTLSPTYYTAQDAAKISSSDVTVVDSMATSGGLAYQVTKAAECIKRGRTVKEILTKLSHTRTKTRTFFSVSDNNQLISKNIISKLRGAIESKLKTSYIFQFVDNNFDLITRSQAGCCIEDFWNEQLLKMHDENIVKLTVLHAGEEKWASLIKKMLEKEFPFVPIEVRITKPEMASYMGLRSTGLTYLLG